MVRYTSNGWAYLDGPVRHPDVRHYAYTNPHTQVTETRYKFHLQPEVVADLADLPGLDEHLNTGLYKAWDQALQTSNQIKQLEPDQIEFGHDFELPPFPHQKVALAFARHLPSAALFMETGTGKTYVALLCAATRLLKGLVSKVLVIAPRSILRTSWWADCKQFTNLDAIVVHNGMGTYRWPCPMCDKEVLSLSDSHAKEHWRVFNFLADCFGDEQLMRKETTAARFHEFLDIPTKTFEWNERKDIEAMVADGFDMYFSSPDTIRIYEDEFLEAGFDMVILDESTMIKNPSSKRTKIIHKLGHQTPFKIILSGTPITNSLEDIWSQMYFLDQSLGPHVGEFYKEYFHQPNAMKYPDFRIPLKGSKDAIVERIANRSLRITKAEALDLPPQTTKLREVGMSRASEKAYRTMLDEFYALVENEVNLEVLDQRRVRLPTGIDFKEKSVPKWGDVFDGDERLGRGTLEADGSGLVLDTDAPLEPGKTLRLRRIEGEVTATIQLAQLIKLQQITNGFVIENLPDESRITHQIDKIPPKIREVKHLVDQYEPGRKMIIWAQYKEDFRQLEDHLDNTVTLNGSTPSNKIESITREFCEGDAQFMLAHPASAQYGHTWVEANITIFYTLSYSLLQYMQARDRCYRIGQVNPVTEYILIGSPTDQKIWDSLMENKQFADKITNHSQMRSLLRELEP